MTDPAADLYSFIFKSIEAEPRFRRGPAREPKAPASPAMLARQYKGVLPADYRCEPKIDGVRVIVTVDPATATVSMRTRNGNPLPSLDHLSGWFWDIAEKHEVHTFDCEAVSIGGFFDSVGNIRAGERDPNAVLWLLDLPDSHDTYRGRRLLIESFDYSGDHNVRLVPSLDIDYVSAFRLFTQQGQEGVMIKDCDGLYEQGKRSSGWLKVKAMDTEECAIVSVHEGKGRLAGMMGHVVVEHGGKLVRVGGGFTDQQRQEIWASRESVIGSWLEVSFQSSTPSGSLRHPRIRGDK